VSNSPTRDRVRIIKQEQSWRGWAKITSVVFSFLRSDGRWQEQRREVYDRGHGAAVLLYNIERKTVVLVRQFRLACMMAGDDGMLLEVPAGMLDAHNPEDCIRREIEEETGFQIAHVDKLFEAYSTPGSVTEKLHYFAASYTAKQRISSGGGSVDEGEDIEVIELGFAEAFAMIGQGKITDAKTILLLQHAALTVFAHPVRSVDFPESYS
jgi:nudix-type nucleoside diphosphatase (YffH/AdpP family)